MVRMKYSKIERTAGIFLLFCLFCFLGFVFIVATKQGWFEKKTAFYTIMSSAEGLREGSEVQMTGFKVGKVDSIELTTEQKIRVNFSVLEKYANKIKKDSVLFTSRQFIIGEKQIEIQPGSPNEITLTAGEEIKNQEVFDLMAVLSGKNVNQYVKHLSTASENLANLLKALTDEKRTRSLVRTFDRVEPLMKNVNEAVKELATLGSHLNQDQKMVHLVQNLNQLTEDFQGLGATMKQMGPKLPETTQRAVEALNETVIVLKALQKSFLIESHVEKVKEEEAKRRLPADKP